MLVLATEWLAVALGCTVASALAWRCCGGHRLAARGAAAARATGCCCTGGHTHAHATLGINNEVAHQSSSLKGGTTNDGESKVRKAVSWAYFAAELPPHADYGLELDCAAFRSDDDTVALVSARDDKRRLCSYGVL